MNAWIVYPIGNGSVWISYSNALHRSTLMVNFHSCCDVNIIYIYIYWLALSTPPKNISQSIGIIIPRIRKSIECSKPPTSIYIYIPAKPYRHLLLSIKLIVVFWHGGTTIVVLDVKNRNGEKWLKSTSFIYPWYRLIICPHNKDGGFHVISYNYHAYIDT